MKIAHVRKYVRRRGAFSALLSRNPVLVLGLDLPFVIACATSLKNAVALSIEMFIIHMATILVALITVRKLPQWLRMLVNVGAAFVVMTIARHLITLIFPDIANHVGMYIYLMAVNGITIYQCSQIKRRAKPGPILVAALMNALAFSLTMLAVSLLREYFAGGTLWGVAVALPIRLSGLSLPFGGFVFIGLLLAFTRFMNKKLLAFSISEASRRDARYIDLARQEDSPEQERNHD